MIFYYQKVNLKTETKQEWRLPGFRRLSFSASQSSSKQVEVPNAILCCMLERK